MTSFDRSLQGSQNDNEVDFAKFKSVPERLCSIISEVRENMKESRAKNKVYYDAKH